MKWQEYRFRRIRGSKLALFSFGTMTAFYVETSHDSEVKTSSHNEADLSASQKKTLGQTASPTFTKKAQKKNCQRSTDLLTELFVLSWFWVGYLNAVPHLLPQASSSNGNAWHRHPTNRKNGEHNMLSLEYSRLLIHFNPS